MLKYPSIAVDFDGTLGYSKPKDYPKISYINKYAVDVLNEYRKRGGILILWTCRANKHLELAVEALKKAGLEFDAINENTKEAIDDWLKKYPNSGISPKVFCSMYIEDRAFGTHVTGLNWGAIKKEILKEY